MAILLTDWFSGHAGQALVGLFAACLVWQVLRLNQPGSGTGSGK